MSALHDSRRVDRYDHPMRRFGAFACALGTTISAGCVAPHATERSDSVRIEILGFGDCPNTSPFRERVEAAARQVGEFTVVSVDQESLSPTDLRRGYPAPTALLDGRDLFGLPTPDTTSLACRMYPGGLPSVDEIADRLRSSQRP